MRRTRAVRKAGRSPTSPTTSASVPTLGFGTAFVYTASFDAASFKIVVKEAAVTGAQARCAPVINGIVRVGETLTADVSGIADRDRLENAVFSYQWVRNDGTADTHIADAAGVAYTLVSDDEGKTIKVEVSFTDDEGNPRDADQQPHREGGGSAS